LGSAHGCEDLTAAPMRHVLVVDDHRLMGEAVAALVREVEPALRVSVTGSLQQALALAERDAPDAAIVDLQLPDGRGETLMQALRRRRPALPMLVFSACEPDEAGLARLFALGARRFCAKSAGHDALLAALRQLLAPVSLAAPQLELLRLLCQDLSSQDIGRRLGLAPAATRDSIDGLFRLLQVRSRSQIVAVARAQGLIE